LALNFAQGLLICTNKGCEVVLREFWHHHVALHLEREQKPGLTQDQRAYVDRLRVEKPGALAITQDMKPVQGLLLHHGFACLCCPEDNQLCVPNLNRLSAHYVVAHRGEGNPKYERCYFQSLQPISPNFRVRSFGVFFFEWSSFFSESDVSIGVPGLSSRGVPPPKFRATRRHIFGH